MGDKEINTAIKLLSRWMKAAESGNYRDKANLSIKAHPVYDDTFGFIEYLEEKEKTA